MRMSLLNRITYLQGRSLRGNNPRLTLTKLTSSPFTVIDVVPSFIASRASLFLTNGTRLSNTEMSGIRSWFLVGIGRSKDVEHGDASYNGGGGQAAGHGSDLHGDGLHEGGLHAGGLHGGRLHGGGSEQRWMPRLSCELVDDETWYTGTPVTTTPGIADRRGRVLSPVFNQLSVIRRRIETSRGIMGPFVSSSTLLPCDPLSRKCAFMVFAKPDVTKFPRRYFAQFSAVAVPRLLRCHYRRQSSNSVPATSSVVVVDISILECDT